MRTDIIRIATANKNSQNKVYLIYLCVYGFKKGSLLVHGQGGQLLENMHHKITKIIIIKKVKATRINGICNTV